MSGIAGVLYRDGQRAETATLRQMADRLAHRGPDARDAWADGPVGLAHAMLRTTPESLAESLPLVAGPFAITADARIDNRDVLVPQLQADLAALGLDRGGAPDSGVVLAAYARWGADCVDHLLGAFAFAIWDGREQRLVCARDHFGIRPLYTVDLPGRLFAFASEPKSLFELADVDPVLDERRVAESLAARLYEPVETAFRDVVRLPAAHVLTADRAGTARRRYWELQPSSAPAPASYAERFAELFDQAVRCRVRSAFPVGAELSGGLDSSAVTVVAARLLAETGGLPLHTVSLAYSDPASDERPFGQAVLDRLGDAAVDHYVEPERERIVDLYTEVYQTLDDFRVRGNGYGNYLTAREIGRHGVRVLLTGQDGDTAVGHGWERFAELALAGDWAGVDREAAQVFAHCRADQDRSRSQFSFTQPSQIASAHIRPLLQWWAEEAALIPFARASRGLHRQFGAPALGPARHYWRQMVLPGPVRRRLARNAALATAAQQVPPVAAPDLVRRTGLQQRLADQILATAAEGRGRFTTAEAQLRSFRSVALEGNLNKLDLYPAASGVEARHPFMDVRLVEYCVSLPSSQKLRDGWTRAVLRDAVGHELPELVLSRMNKMDHGSQQDDFIFRSQPERVDQLLVDPGPAAGYLDLDAARALWRRGAADPDTLDEWEVAWISAAVTLILWFKVSPLVNIQ